MKRAIKYTAAMLLVSASLNAYAKTKISTSGKIKVDVNSTTNGPANKDATDPSDWSGYNLNANKVQVSLNIETEKFDAKLTLDAGQWYNKSLTVDGSNVASNKPKDLSRLLDEAYITFKAAGGEITLGKQHIVLVPRMESSSLGEDSKKEQVIAIRFTHEGRKKLAGIGIDASLYETESYDNKVGDELGINIILSKDINKDLTVFLALQNEKDSSDKRKNKITARGVYKINSKLNVSAQYQMDRFDGKNSSFKVGSEYKLSKDMVIGASYYNYDADNSSASTGTATVDIVPNKSHTEFRAYGVKQINEDTSLELYWSKKELESQKDASGVEEKQEPSESIGVRLDVKF
ncbi:MAG: hypothetical protein HAW60_02020 [Bdellovibrionales bacterium]|nr:hypothetical protein [Bdellovibrionales bacterium]